MTTGDKELMINGVCVRNNANNEGEEDENMEKSNEDEDHDEDENKKNDENDEDEIRRSFIKKPSLEESDDVQVKKELEEAGGWEF